MRIGELARRAGTSAHAVRYYERDGLLPPARRSANGFREYGPEAEERLRLLLGLRGLDVPLPRAAELATMCADGRCGQVSHELRSYIAAQRAQIKRRARGLHDLDRRLARLEGQLAAGDLPRPLIMLGKEERDGNL
ncbi:MAG: MerR family transcriptional regulator [Candidatus Limnocylindria bacterium]